MAFSIEDFLCRQALPRVARDVVSVILLEMKTKYTVEAILVFFYMSSCAFAADLSRLTKAPAKQSHVCSSLENQLKTAKVSASDCKDLVYKIVKINNCTELQKTSAYTYFYKKCDPYLNPPAASAPTPTPSPSASASPVADVPAGVYSLRARPYNECKAIAVSMSTVRSHPTDCMALVQKGEALNCKALTNDPMFWDVTADFCSRLQQ